MKRFFSLLVTPEKSQPTLFSLIQAITLLASQFYVGWVFFKAGLTKIKDWDTTIFLFEDEYAVPLLSPEVAAFLGTFGELVFPILLFMGLFSRLGALGLFFVNIVAVISLEDTPQAALDQHIVWGILLLIIFAFGASKLSLDTLMKKWLN